jgi:bifunctional ADP-heptose synthase (sugar kinase/adenylyltransferase)
MKNIEDIRILVVGDVMLDKYIVGEVERISPEAPVPIVKVTEEYSTLGGCGNVVRNLREIGVNCSCLATVGRDAAGSTIIQKLESVGANTLIIYNGIVTTQKERIVADQRKIQMLRVDREQTEDLESKQLINKLIQEDEQYDIILVSDYAKGIVTFELMEFLKKLNVPIIVDPKPINRHYYKGVYMITPNQKEFSQMSSFIESRYILITKGKDGMTLLDHVDHWDIPAVEIHYVFNVSGAGDTVLAIMGVCTAMGIGALQSAKIANLSAGHVVTLPGTSTIPKNKFMKYFALIMEEK